MNSDLLGVILSGSINFILHDDGDLTLLFRPGLSQSKLTAEDAIRLSQAFGGTLKNVIQHLSEAGRFCTSLPQTFELKMNMVSR